MNSSVTTSPDLDPEAGTTLDPNAGKKRPSRPFINWLDVPGLAFLVGLALLPPINEFHKQLILLAFGVMQLSEGWLVARFARRGSYALVLTKIALATILIDHTGTLGINSTYYPVFYLPVITAALYFGPIGTLLWTLLASAAYTSYLFPAMQEYSIDSAGFTVLAIRVAFFFLAAMVVNRVVVEYKRQSSRYQILSEQLSQTNRLLRVAQAEKRRTERLAALGQLTAGLAHEIRNPLGIIKGSAEMLNQKLQSSEPVAAELAGYISSEVNRLSALVSRFLDFARPLQAETRPGNILEPLQHALQLVTSRWQGGAITVEKSFPLDLPMVPLDERLCEQVFLNLLQNACEAMGDAGGTLTVKAEAAQRNETSGVEIRIQDTGAGIPEAMREQIFNPFVTTKSTGVGLGLSIVSKIMDEHAGSIWLEPVTGPGTCFALFFPQEESEATATSDADPITTH